MRDIPLRLPDDPLARVRLVFVAFSLGSAPLLLGVLVAGSAHLLPATATATAALAVLAAKWVGDYRHPGGSPTWDLLEAVVLLGLGVLAGSPLVILLLLYARLSASALEHTPRRVALATAAYAAAFAGTAALAPGAGGAQAVEDLFLASGFPLAATVMRLLGDTLRRLAEAGARERARVAQQTLESEATFRSMFDNNPQPMWIHDEQTLRFVAVNQAAMRGYGYSREEFAAMSVAEVAGDDPGRHRRRDGGAVEVETTEHRLPFRGRPSVFVIARDVTRERALQDQLRRQAFHDALTGLPNRALLDERAAHAMRRARRRSTRRPVVLVLDLDGFKSVNDTVGHAHGDEVISTVARRITACLRPGDTAARLGGDEFAVLLEDVGDVAEAVAVAQRLVQAIEEPYRLAGRTLSLSACVGIARCGGGDTTVSGLLSDADLAMYVAKGRGRGAHQVFTTDLRTALTERLRMQEQLSAALRNDELRVVYQPQVDLATRRVTGVEALVRWTHPTHGEVPPDVFIPMAEQLGLVTEIDMWVLRTACADLARRREAGLPGLRVAVNISGRDLDSDTLVDDVRTALVEQRLDPWHLELELTESIAMHQTEAAVQRLQALRALGIRIGIDDFGTGYSMFSRLRDLPIDRLKIDRSFVRDLARDDDATAIVRSTVAMGHALGLTLVAEGVESEEVMLRLAEMGCDSAQGFYVCLPLPAEELRAWLAAYAAGEPGCSPTSSTSTVWPVSSST
jgi:diguanylate cyclase (GGDEF)-like protein